MILFLLCKICKKSAFYRFFLENLTREIINAIMETIKDIAIITAFILQAVAAGVYIFRVSFKKKNKLKTKLTAKNPKNFKFLSKFLSIEKYFFVKKYLLVFILLCIVISFYIYYIFINQNPLQTFDIVIIIVNTFNLLASIRFIWVMIIYHRPDILHDRLLFPSNKPYKPPPPDLKDYK